MRKLRLYFGLFFLLLALPIGVLIRHTYANLEQESFYFYRKAAEGLLGTVSRQVRQNLQSEEQRPYTHYRYIYVADRPLPRQEGLNLSPLASFPVESEIPGILGYYQIDPDGSFHTPLLPDGVSPVQVAQKRERERLRDRLAALLEGRLFFSSRSSDARQAERRARAAAAAGSAFSDFQRNLESSVDTTLERDYPLSREYRALPEDAAEEAPESARRLQKSSPKQALVFDSARRDSDLDEPGGARERAAVPEGAQDQSAPLSAERRNRRLPGEDDRLESQDDEMPAEGEVVAEVDPFRSELLDAEWLVFHRRVWSQNRRYLQGFVTRAREFLEAHLGASLADSALPATASYLLFYRGEMLPAGTQQARDPKPLLLYSGVLPHPLADFQVAITVPSLPESPAYQMVNFLAVILSLLFIGGLLGVYRLAASQLELSQKKSDFVAAVSHELKTPLTAIRMYGELLMEEWVQEEKKRRYYQHIHDESERLSRLIQNVLTLAELERKAWQIKLALHDPVELVAGVAERLGDQVRRAGFELVFVPRGQPDPIQVDADALTQILINLIDNAVKFSMDAETRKIVLTVSQEGPDCCVRVRDFGPGIPAQKLKRIFEKFYRLDNEMTRTSRGTGIGLSLVKMLAEAAGARLEVANRRPGTEFSIRFSGAAAVSSAGKGK